MKNNGFIVIGDTHDNHRLIRHRLKALQLEDMTLLHVGDFGVGFAKNYHTDIVELKRLNAKLEKRNCHFYVILNHG